MKILIAQSYFRVLDPKEENKNMPYPPLGSIIVASHLRDLGHEITFYDCMIAENTEELYNYINNQNPDILLLYDDEFNYLTKMSLLNMRENTFSIIKYAKKINLPTIVYTSDAIDHPGLYLNSGAELIIIGEGETVLEDLLDKMAKMEDWKIFLKNIPGIAYLDNGITLKNQKEPLRSNLDELPDPDYNGFVDLSKYRQIWLRQHGYFSINITTSRGCTYGCNWCAKPLWGRTYNAISPRRIVNLLRKLHTNYDVNHVWITDDIFGLRKGWLKEFAKICQDENFTIPYKCLSRADLLIKGDTANLLQQSGCTSIWIGAESGSQKILDAMEKGTKVHQIYEATKLVKSLDMDIAFFLQLGYLGEEWDDIKMTRKLVNECLPSDLGISVSYPLPGTKFYNIVKEQLSEKQNWQDSDDLDMLFHGTYSHNFYKSIHKLIHNEYRFRLTMKKLRIRKIPKLIYHLSMLIKYNIKINHLRKKEDLQKQNASLILPIVG